MAGSDKLDAGLQKIINQALNGILDTDREDNAPVTSEDMEELTSLVIDSGDDVEDLDGLRYAVNLTSLSVYGDMADCRTGHKRRQRGNLEIFRLDLFCRKRCSAGYRILVFRRTPACMGDSFLCMVRRWKNLYCQKSMRGE